MRKKLRRFFGIRDFGKCRACMIDPAVYLRRKRFQRSDFQGSPFKVDMAAKRRKKHKNKISGLVISMGYNEQKSKF